MIFSAARTRRIPTGKPALSSAHPRYGPYQAATTKQQKNAHYQGHLETVWWHVFLNWSSAAGTEWQEISTQNARDKTSAPRFAAGKHHKHSRS
jgi:hypothetical protein